MDIVKRDQFIALWRKYFNDAELPVAFYYSKENNNATIVKKAMGHRSEEHTSELQSQSTIAYAVFCLQKE